MKLSFRLLVCMLLSGAAAFSQSVSWTITGTVLDRSSMGVAQATVKLINATFGQITGSAPGRIMQAVLRLSF